MTSSELKNLLLANQQKSLKIINPDPVYRMLI